MLSRNRHHFPRLGVGLAAALLATGLLACGDDDEDGASRTSAKTTQAEKAFLTGMVHHHESAIEMAKIAMGRGKDAVVKGLADKIVATQQREISQMEAIYRRLFDRELVGNPTAHEDLGLSAEQAGMTHTPETNDMLRSANPFDRAFVDEMVPHHKGAVAMSKAVLKSTRDSELRKLAAAIISAQQREIAEMNRFRSRRFGGPAPDRPGQATDSDEVLPGAEGEHEPDHPG